MPRSLVWRCGGLPAGGRCAASLRLLPALERAGADIRVLADEFNRRTRIGGLAARRARHLTEVLSDGLVS